TPTFHEYSTATPLMLSSSAMFEVGAPLRVMVPDAGAPGEAAHAMKSTAAALYRLKSRTAARWGGEPGPASSFTRSAPLTDVNSRFGAAEPVFEVGPMISALRFAVPGFEVPASRFTVR